jgi:hypothetical protein
MTQPTDWLEQAKLEIEEEWHEYQKSNPWGVADRARWRREKLIAERARSMELRGFIERIDDGKLSLPDILIEAERLRYGKQF